MALVVQKYGGTSVGSIERIKHVAQRVIDTKNQGNQVVVVLSAMSGETDRLLSLAGQISPNGSELNERELDVLVSTGEQVSIALLAITVETMGEKACSFLGHQIHILTDSAFTKARIKNIDSKRISQALDEGNIVVVAGFQGIDEHGNITTLGRGGSDTSAVAVATALKADVCEIYTDVDGIYTTDPNVCRQARKLAKISYDEMLELASQGAKVLQIRSVEFAKKYGIPLHVRSSFSEVEGTIVCQEDKSMEKAVVSGVAYNKNEAKITIIGVPDRPGIAASVFSAISAKGIVVDMIIQNISEEGLTDLTFTVPKGDYHRSLAIITDICQEIGAKTVLGDEKIAKVSIVGIGMRTHANVASRMFAALARENINIMMISTSEIKVSCVIAEKYAELAVRVLHDEFELEKDPAHEEQ
ncbi:MAG: aspartate kinase [Deltaproteobacteria bacterium]|nr:aspartate kinase [Candidatus Anaeroferrophillus wilburensis]MBN2888280.1 aspartate kinase [Deltaproteobacteria bacterium]